MALMSPPIPVAASTAYRCDFSGYRRSVSIAVHFFTDAAGTIPVAAPATGSRDVTVTSPRITAHEGPFASPQPVQNFVSLIFNGTATGLPDGTLREFNLAAGMQNIEIVAAPNTPPVGGTHYRILVDANGDSALV